MMKLGLNRLCKFKGNTGNYERIPYWVTEASPKQRLTWLSYERFFDIHNGKIRKTLWKGHKKWSKSDQKWSKSDQKVIMGSWRTKGKPWSNQPGVWSRKNSFANIVAFWGDMICVRKPAKKGTCSAVQFSHDCWPQIGFFSISHGTLKTVLLPFIDSLRLFHRWQRLCRLCSSTLQTPWWRTENYTADMIVQSPENFCKSQGQSPHPVPWKHNFSNVVHPKV